MASPAFQNKTILLTGATTGIGRAAAHAFAQGGARLLVHGRNAELGRDLVKELTTTYGRHQGDITFHQADLTRLDDVRALGREVTAAVERLDVLANNAGLFSSTREMTTDGLEQTFQVNHLAPFLLTRLLMKPLLAARGRVITTSSRAHMISPLYMADLQSKKHFSPWPVYGRTKLANIYFTYELARRHGAEGLKAYCFHPGVVNSRFFSNLRGISKWGANALGKLIFRSSEKGADTLVWLAGAALPPEQNGWYFFDRKPGPLARHALDRDAALRLWEASEQLAGR
ncbi:MAG: SDR family NAD(P)-dependent oxidoreductase [Deltaproteobacteria bacterium]|nr:SDR family NAD(P)-dependent oxidoreductase [Deltaproteobacteria bacterium]